MSEHDEYAPALGGTRAQPEPPPAAEPAPPPPSAAGGGAADPELPPELAAFLGPLGRLAELFADAGSAPGAQRPPYVPGAPDGAIEALLNDTLRSFTDRLPPALAAFGTIVDAVEEVLTPLLDELGTAVREAGAADAGNLQAPADEIVDAVPMDEDEAEAVIPPVDLPPGA